MHEFIRYPFYLSHLAVIPVYDSGALFSSSQQQFSWRSLSPLSESPVILQLLLRIFQGTSSFSPFSSPKASVLSFCYSSILLPDTKFCSGICCCLTNHSQTACLKAENVLGRIQSILCSVFNGIQEKLYPPTYACPNNFSFSA